MVTWFLPPLLLYIQIVEVMFIPTYNYWSITWYLLSTWWVQKCQNHTTGQTLIDTARRFYTYICIYLGYLIAVVIPVTQAVLCYVQDSGRLHKSVSSRSWSGISDSYRTYGLSLTDWANLDLISSGMWTVSPPMLHFEINVN